MPLLMLSFFFDYFIAAITYVDADADAACFHAADFLRFRYAFSPRFSDLSFRLFLPIHATLMLVD